MRLKIRKQITNFDFASLYPGILVPIDKSKFRRNKIEHLIKNINDKRTNKDIPSG